MAEQEATLANLNQRYGPRHPKMLQVQSQISQQRANLDQAVRQLADALGNSYKAAVATEKKLTDALGAQEKSALELNKIAIPYNVLQREVESDKALYDVVLKRLKELDTSQNVGVEEIKVTDPATVPNAPARPRTKLALAVGLVGGMSLGVFFSLVLALLSDSYKTVDEAEAELGLTAVGLIPLARRRSGSADLPIVATQPDSNVAEGFRTLRTSLAFHEDINAQDATLLFTSALPGEGKSFCALNYAASLAQQNFRVLLIDADLRVPSIGKALGIDPSIPGLSEYLAGRARFQELIFRTPVENLFVLPGGKRVRRPAELLGDGGFEDLIQEAENEFDQIVVDSAPIHSVSDTLLLIRHISAFCLVVRAAKTPRRAVIRALRKLTSKSSQPVGFIFNGLPRQSGDYYGYASQRYGPEAYASAESPTSM
ncbi:MAG: polysaccharide biosynthesis tyrosine autokinase [Bryobacteraceae bacterium]